MTEQTRDAPIERETAKETGAVLLAVGGLAAAFGAASCCALPVLLGSLGLGSAWLFGIAIIAAPHRLALVTAAAICLVGAGLVMIWRRRAIACAHGSVCAHRAVTPLIVVVLSLGAALAVAGFLFA
jgi:mercuric ion transport protein